MWAVVAVAGEVGVDDFLLKKQQVFHSLESVTFIWFIVIATVIAVIYGYNKYWQLKTDALIQIKMFNGNIYFNDKAFFEDYQGRRELTKKDFLAMYSDVHFREHLLHKEPNYYKELIKIVENLRLLRFYRRSALILFVGIASLATFVYSSLPVPHRPAHSAEELVGDVSMHAQGN